MRLIAIIAERFVRRGQWRAAVACLVAVAMVFGAVTPLLANVTSTPAKASHADVAQVWAVDGAQHSNQITDDDCNDGACLTYHGSHCHHQAVGQDVDFVRLPSLLPLALTALDDLQRVSHLTWPNPKPPRA